MQPYHPPVRDDIKQHKWKSQGSTTTRWDEQLTPRISASAHAGDAACEDSLSSRNTSPDVRRANRWRSAPSSERIADGRIDNPHPAQWGCH